MIDDPHHSDTAIAQRALPLLDLTDLGDSCSDEAIATLCGKARASRVAAVCVWPQHIGRCVSLLAGTTVRIATVINFPAGGTDIERAVEDTAEALHDGAHEIDLVLPYRAFLTGDSGMAARMIEAVREIAGRAILKVILESGAMRETGQVAKASRLAIAAGADFLKTSTGKSAISATPEAAETMLAAIRDSGRPVGFKVSGGLRTVADAALYLAIADRIMGPGWVGPKTFRIGASSLHDALAQSLGEHS